MGPLPTPQEMVEMGLPPLLATASKPGTIEFTDGDYTSKQQELRVFCAFV